MIPKLPQHENYIDREQEQLEKKTRLEKDREEMNKTITNYRSTKPNKNKQDRHHSSNSSQVASG